MKKESNNLSVLLNIQFGAAVFLFLLMFQSYFIGDVNNLFGDILGVIQQLLIIPVILFTLVCFVVGIKEVLFKRSHHKSSVLLLVVSGSCIVLMVVATIIDLT